MAFKEEHLREADRQVRRINTLMKRAASMFGVNSEVYRERESMLIAAIGSESSPAFHYDPTTGALQVKRGRAALGKASENYAQKMLTKIETRGSEGRTTDPMKATQKKMLDAYTRRKQDAILAQIHQNEAAGIMDNRELHAQLQAQDPRYVPPDIKGRKAREAARKQQVAAATREQADYYTRLNAEIKEALQLIYDIEKNPEVSAELAVHTKAKRMSPIWSTTEEKEQLLHELYEEIARQDHTISKEYESGLAGNILGVGGIT